MLVLHETQLECVLIRQNGIIFGNRHTCIHRKCMETTGLIKRRPHFPLMNNSKASLCFFYSVEEKERSTLPVCECVLVSVYVKMWSGVAGALNKEGLCSHCIKIRALIYWTLTKRNIWSKMKSLKFTPWCFKNSNLDLNQEKETWVFFCGCDEHPKLM